MQKEKKNKHMTLEDRNEIQNCLDHGMTFKAIAARISKDQTTVSKEIKKHVVYIPSSVTRIDKETGKSIEEGIGCPALMKPPYVCNPCKKAYLPCSYTKQRYVAKKADDEYRDTLSVSREGIPLNKEEFYEMDRIVSDGIKKGQHLYHIINSNNLDISKSSVYRYAKKDYLSASQMDFPRIVKFRQRKHKKETYVPKGLKVGRTYDDFCTHLLESGIDEWVEMDTIIGRIGGKIIFTLHFMFCNFMVGILLDNKTAAELSSKIIALKQRFKDKGLRFGDIIPLALADNGGEFSDIFSIINDSDGNEETKLFFCDPYQSSQKPFIEKNHTMVRDILPKGTSFDDLSQKDVNLIFSHVNGVQRKSLYGKSPYDMFVFTVGKDVADVFGISYIPPKEVIQSEKLLEQTLHKHN